MFKAEYPIPFLTFTLSLVIFLTGLAAPIGNGLFGYPNGELFYTYLSPICHQQPLRSYWLFDHPLALCARCTGGYLGVIIGCIFCFYQFRKFPHSKRMTIYTLSFIGLFLLSVGEAYLKIWDSNLSRFISGFGGGLGFGGMSYIIGIILSIIYQRINNFISEFK